MSNTINVKTLDDQISKNFATLVSFYWDEDYSQQSNYIAWTEDLTITTIEYESIPELEVKMGTQHGGAKDAPIKISIPGSFSPINKLARPFPHSDVKVLVAECDPYDAVNTYNILFLGYITKINLGRYSSNSLAELTVSGLKSQSEFPVGFPANSDCILDLFNSICKVPEEEYSSTIQSISSDGMTILVSTPVEVTTTTEEPTTTGV